MITVDNHISQYRIETVTCPKCNGSRIFIPFDRYDVLPLIKGLSLKWAKKLILHWKQYGYITCPECSGKGTREIML